jgi:1,4-alpha-glucan branching enzyme
MSTIVHYQVADGGKTWTLHAWSDEGAWDRPGQVVGNYIDFELPVEIGDLRKVHFKLRSADDKGTYWEDDRFIRNIRLASAAEIWCFPDSPRLIYEQPSPPGAGFAAGDTLTLRVITRSRFEGGAIYVWNPYDRNQDAVEFPESARNKSTLESTFTVPLQAWMTNGFNFKLVKRSGDDSQWESDSANRVWRPGDGNSMWVKSGQVNIRKSPLVLTDVQVEVLYPATMSSPPTLYRNDLGEARRDPISATHDQLYMQGNLFRVASYSVEIYPDAPYTVCAANGAEGSDCSIVRAFPPDPNDVTAPARFVLGGEGWIASFPDVIPSARILIEQHPSDTAFGGGIQLTASVGAAPPYETVSAIQQADGTWQATLNVVVGTRTYVNFVPANGPETRLYDWVDTSRHFDAPSVPTDFFATEGVFGLTSRGKTQFDEPSSRRAVMEAAFGTAIVVHGVFGAKEMPHGATIAGDDVYFVVHAPHAVWAALVFVSDTGPGGPARRIVPMALTPDLLYWWCKVPKRDTPPGTRYRFALNDRDEVLDPAARVVRDGGSFQTSPDDDPGDSARSWSVVLDVADIYRRAHRQPWDTAGWESLLIYELHARRFTQLEAGSKLPLELLTDELRQQSRLGKMGYLRQLPVTALELMPVHEYEGSRSWGYNPAFYFAVDSSYGGAGAMADFVDAAHAAGKAVILDVVYNHSQASPLMKIARDVYRNGEAWGDRMNCGHPMVLEFLRQATIYMWRTFNLCGFRFDDTKTIVRDCSGGWGFLGAIREALQRAASAEGRRYPYVVAENDQENKAFDIPHPGWGVLHGEWAWDEVYRIREVSYNTWHDEDDANRLKQEMDRPSFDGRPFYIAVRQAENHDRVSGQDGADKRIASRPPFGQGLRMAKALGTIPLLSNGVPLLFMGQEYGETRPFSFDNYGQAIDPQSPDLSVANTRVAAWFSGLMGLRNDPAKGLRGQANYQVISTGRRTLAFTCGADQNLFVVVTWGTPDLGQDSSWLGLPGGTPFKEIFNSSWPCFEVESEEEHTNGGYDAQIYRGYVINLPYIGAVVLERR